MKFKLLEDYIYHNGSIKSPTEFVDSSGESIPLIDIDLEEFKRLKDLFAPRDDRDDNSYDDYDDEDDYDDDEEEDDYDNDFDGNNINKNNQEKENEDENSNQDNDAKDKKVNIAIELVNTNNTFVGREGLEPLPPREGLLARGALARLLGPPAADRRGRPRLPRRALQPRNRSLPFLMRQSRCLLRKGSSD